MARPKKEYWRPGEQRALCKLVGIRQGHLTEILKGNRNVSPDRAKDLAAAAEDIKKDIPAEAWLRLKEHKAFK